MQEVVNSGLVNSFNAIFQYLYHSLIFKNRKMVKEGEYLFNLALKRLEMLNKLKKKNDKFFLIKGFNIYFAKDKESGKKMLFDDLVEETLLLRELNGCFTNLESIKELKELIKEQ